MNIGSEERQTIEAESKQTQNIAEGFISTFHKHLLFEKAGFQM